ncbi:MAG TPA: hypothetical protein VFO86_02595 [Terriglobia bacterium]|nr:hypothetical protein [Terriglobia bacterium]
MNSKLEEFFKSERARVFEPGPYFTQRVMAGLAGMQKENGIWEGVLAGARPIFALAMVLLLGVMAIQLFLPDMPERGAIESVLSPDQTDGEHMIFTGADPSSPELEKMIIIMEDGQ